MIALAITVFMPLMYFMANYRLELAMIETEAEINARIASQMINANPTSWRFQQPKLEEFLKRRASSSERETRRIEDRAGKLIVESAEELSGPILWHSADLLDSGVKVGSITIGRSLRPLIYRTAGVTLFSLFIGWGSFVFLRILALKALERATEENANLVRSLEKQVADSGAANARLTALHEIEGAIASSLNLDAVLKLLLEKTDGLIPVISATTVRLLNRETGGLEPVACWNLNEEEWKAETRAAAKRGLSGMLPVNNAPVQVLDARTDPRSLASAFLRKNGVISSLRVPLVIRDKVLGVMTFFTRETHEFGAEEVEFLSTVAGQAAIAIHNAQLYEESMKSKDKLEQINTVLAQQAAELARSNTELEQFAYVASHDLQEPLRMITGYTNLLAKRYKDKLDKDANEFISFAVDGAKRMHCLINDLLTYSRVGTRPKEFTPVHCETVLAKTLLGLHVALQECGATVTHEPLPTLMGDETQLGQLFQNLVGNGIKYRNSKRPEVYISCRRDSGNWLFAVKDNGIGIDPQYAERIFLIFQRLHTREEYAGTGIGLAVCKKIVERHSGRIWVESELGKGATFFFTLPALVEEQITAADKTNGFS